MKKLLILLLFFPSVFAYVVPIEHNGIHYKFYSEDINKSRCFEYVDRIPSEYLKGIKTIKVFSERSDVTEETRRRVYWGQFYPGIIKDLYSCNDIIYHEVAHNVQMLKGDSYYQMANHLGHFNESYEEVIQSVEERYNVSLTRAYSY